VHRRKTESKQRPWFRTRSVCAIPRCVRIVSQAHDDQLHRIGACSFRANWV
jgi:hypothetical protein